MLGWQAVHALKTEAQPGRPKKRRARVRLYRIRQARQGTHTPAAMRGGCPLARPVADEEKRHRLRRGAQFEAAAGCETVKPLAGNKRANNRAERLRGHRLFKRPQQIFLGGGRHHEHLLGRHPQTGKAVPIKPPVFLGVVGCVAKADSLARPRRRACGKRKGEGQRRSLIARSGAE